jgi:hypothetical protein
MDLLDLHKRHLQYKPALYTYLTHLQLPLLQPLMALDQDHFQAHCGEILLDLVPDGKAQ